MRLYRFLDAHWGMQSIAGRRLRISRITDLNDEFEFIGLALEDKKQRLELRAIREHLNRENGIICMSASYSSPLLWGHYADKMKGVALGFDVAPIAFEEVEYREDRPTLSDIGCETLDEIGTDDIKRLVSLKFNAWSYEEEYRTFQKLRNPDSMGNYFVPFSENMQLTEVVVGPRSELKRSDVSDALGDIKGVDVFKARAGFRNFEVVRNRKESMWT